MVFGCGGTGSRFVPLLAQFIKTLNYIMDPQILLFDFDVVENKNLLRQNFIASDVGKNKAEVLAQRYSKAYGIDIRAFKDDITKLMSDGTYPAWTNTVYGKSALVFLCVDSVEARKKLMKSLDLHRNFGGMKVLVFDSGNENDFGQVQLSGSLFGSMKSSVIEALPDKVFVDGSLPFFPANPFYFEEMEPPAETRSCADLDQTMAINSLVANVMFSTVQNLLFAKPISYHRVNISLQHGCTPEYITPRYLKEIARKYNNFDNGYASYGFNYSHYNDFGLELVKQHKAFLKAMTPEPANEIAVEESPKKASKKKKVEDLVAA